MIKSLFALFAIAALGSAIYSFVSGQGLEYCLGALSAIVLYQFSHRVIHGRWIEF
jgi:hypothetical protein